MKHHEQPVRYGPCVYHQPTLREGGSSAAIGIRVFSRVCWSDATPLGTAIPFSRHEPSWPRFCMLQDVDSGAVDELHCFGSCFLSPQRVTARFPPFVDLPSMIHTIVRFESEMLVVWDSPYLVVLGFGLASFRKIQGSRYQGVTPP